MFIHGREAYRRNSFLILYTFYKNILYISCQYVFGFWSGFSAQVLYEPFIYQMYNITFTSIPIMFYCLFDFEYEKFRPLNIKGDFSKDKKKYFMSDPSLFRIGIDYSCFSFQLFTLYLLYGLVQSTIIFMLCFFLLNTNDMQPGGKNIGFWVTGHMVYGVCIIVANIVIMFRYHNFTGWSEWCSIGMSLNFFTILQFSSMYIPSFD